MIELDELPDDELQLRARMATAASVPMGGRADGALHPPSAHTALVLGRRARARRRFAAGAAGMAACLLVAGGGVAVGTGTLLLPGLEREADGAGPASLLASRGTPVGDVVNAIDPGFASFAMDDFDSRTWFYRSGGPRVATPSPDAAQPDVDPDSVDLTVPGEWDEAVRRQGLKVARVDRAVEVRRSREADDGNRREYTFSLAQTRPGTDEAVSSRDLGAVSLGEGGRGGWMAVRPSAEDGWLVLAVLPAQATAVQARVAGTDVVLPLDSEVVESACLDEGGAVYTDDGTPPCDVPSPGPIVRLRLAMPDAKPPIDAITYVNKDGKYVVLGAEALVH